MNETDSHAGAHQAKKPYIKPHIQEVPLRPDEAVLGGCKTSSKSGPTQAKCTVPRKCSTTTS